MKLSITGARSELGRVLAQMPARGPDGSIHVNIAGQQANTLLHDGHAWKDFARTMPGTTRRALRAAEAAGAGLFIHASFAFVRAVERGANLGEPLQSCVAAILESEAMVLAGALPACVVRLGYLYGAHSADLRAYRTAFRLGRPYWSIPRTAASPASIRRRLRAAGGGPGGQGGQDLVRHRRPRRFVRGLHG